MKLDRLPSNKTLVLQKATRLWMRISTMMTPKPVKMMEKMKTLPAPFVWRALVRRNWERGYLGPSKCCSFNSVGSPILANSCFTKDTFFLTQFDMFHSTRTRINCRGKVSFIPPYMYSGMAGTKR